MSLKAKNEPQKEFELVPPGQYIGRCFRLIDLGTQEDTYLGTTKHQKKVLIAWELTSQDEDIKMEDGRPFSMSKKYTNTMFEKGNLYKDLIAWRGVPFTPEEAEEFDLTNILGKYALIQVSHKKGKSDPSKVYTEITGLMSYKGKDKPEPINPDQAFDIDEPDMKIYDELPKYYQELIQKSEEWVTKAAQEDPTKPVKTKDLDVVIEDIDPDQPLDLSSIPF